MYANSKIKVGKRKAIAGALAGTVVISSFMLTAFSCEAETVKGGEQNEEVILYADDTQLAAMADKAVSVKGYSDYKNGDYQKVTLSGSEISFEGTGAEVSGSDLLISRPGTYVLSGVLEDGAVIVESSEAENVILVLEDADLTCKDGAPIYIKECGKNVVISVPEGSTSSITDGENYTYEYIEKKTDETTGELSIQPSGAVFSKADLRINGTGTLTVNGNSNDGIAGKDDVEITETTIIVNGKDDGIVGKDSVVIGGGNLTVTAGGDGIKATNADDPAKGYIAIADGSFKITSGNDGIQAESVLLTLDGDYTVKTGEGAALAKAARIETEGNQRGSAPNGKNPPVDGQPTVGEQPPSDGQQPPDGQISFEGRGRGTQKENKSTTGTVNIPSSENTDHAGITKNSVATEASGTATDGDTTESAKALKAGTKVLIQGGSFNIDSEDDGIHSNDYGAIAGGSINIATGDDGIHTDSKLNIYGGSITISDSYEGIEGDEIIIDGGSIDLTSSDDGINGSGGNDGSGFGGFRGGDSFKTSGEAVDTETKAVKLTINGGNIKVNAEGDGIDINGSAVMTGGTVMVIGPTFGGNSGIDYDDKFEVTGGELIVTGAAGMAQAPSSGTTVNTIATALENQQAGTKLSLVNNEGKEILTFTPEKEFSHIVISSALIEKGETYKLMAEGKELVSFTADSTVTNLSEKSKMR